MANSLPVGPYTASTVPVAPPPSGVGPPLLRVVTPQNVSEFERRKAELEAAALRDQDQSATMDQLAAFIRREFGIMRDHRNSNNGGWSERLLEAQRMFNRKYDATKLGEIQRFGGSEIYAGVVSLKCRAASALLREVYLGIEKPWGLEPTPEPELPDDVLGAVSTLVSLEVQGAQAAGQPLDLNMIKDRTNELVAAARMAAKNKAKEEAKIAESKLDDMLIEGGFYDALSEFLTDLPLFPFACIKGPVVRIVADVAWEKGQAVEKRSAKMFWERKSPFDIYFTPGVSRIRDAAVIERSKISRSDLNDLLGLPGYNEVNIRKVLEEYGRGGLVDWIDSTDSQRAREESRENPQTNRSGLIDCLEYHGNIQGKLLLEYGFTSEEIPDDLRDYFVQAWMIGRYVIKCQLSPNPRKRHPYYITSFEKVPGTPVGNALPDILGSIEEAANATLRSLINNLSIASGPQVVVDDTRLAVGEDADELFPWKRWHTTTDPMAPQQNASVPPISFFQPNSHAQELLGVYQSFTNMGDELSAIPKYITGSDKLGGAGRTASGLAMLMGNASKILQMVASNVDNDAIRDLLQGLYDMVMLTDQTGTFRGDEEIRVRGVEVAVQRETARQRQIEFLQATANPFDMQIMGLDGRAKVLREVSKSVGIEGEVIPDEKTLQARLQPAMGPGGPGGAPTMQTGPDGAPVAIPGPPPGRPPQDVLPMPGNQPRPANTDLGVPEANAMRGMTGGA